ncbi:MAG TPA: bis-aminopropyl spermidine synthase family protein, partial [Candidatus Dormibacteraeota bacterium]|nr:bis-aminopropyl spermidine synthase family protein [Candidatus Dormibacteraeota bacterium]
MPDLDQVTRELLDDWGIDATPIRSVVCGLGDGDWRTIGQLVRAHGVSRRSVEELTARLEPWLERQGGRLRVPPEHRESLAAAWACADAAAPAAASAAGAIEAAMAALMRALPGSDRSLDHVAATPATAAARARFLAETFDLARATVVCLGDHDLTSLALAQLCPSADVRVVDVDERILAFVAGTAAERGWRVTPVFADLRVELPPTLRESADLVFTDPPYTPAGMRLFLARGLESLRRRDVGRVVFCYGFGERQPALGLNVQAVFHGLHLVAEAILPRFNRYAGAEALGGVSSLYVCR